MLSDLRARAWQIGCAVLLLALVGAGFAYAVQWAELRHVSKVNARLERQARDDAADLAQSRTNVATLSGKLEAIGQQLASASAVVADASRKVDAANAASALAAGRASSLLNFSPTSADQCERVLEVDRRFVESLNEVR